MDSSSAAYRFKITGESIAGIPPLQHARCRNLNQPDSLHLPSISSFVSLRDDTDTLRLSINFVNFSLIISETPGPWIDSVISRLWIFMRIYRRFGDAKMHRMHIVCKNV